MAKDDSAIGDRLRGLREARGLTQSQVADAIGVDAQTVSRWERGERVPNAQAYTKALALLSGSGLGRLAESSDAYSAVPRTSAEARKLVRALEQRLQAELELRQASQEILDAMATALATADTVRMFADTARPIPPDELARLFSDHRTFVEALKVTLFNRMRIAH